MTLQNTMRRYLDIIKENEALSEIKQVAGFELPYENAKSKIERTAPFGTIDEYTVRYGKEIKDGHEYAIFLLEDNDGEVACILYIMILDHGKQWKEKIGYTYRPHTGKKLIPKLYHFLITKYNMTLISDDEHSLAGRSVWERSLPAMGLVPQVFNNETKQIEPPSKDDISKVFDGTKKYCWIITP